MLIVLYEPEIPPNTGNIARMCAAFGLELHLIEPLGFRLEDRYLKRAGLDYWPHVRFSVWKNWQVFLQRPDRLDGERHIMATTKAAVTIGEFQFHKDDALVFGPETRGLPESLLAASPYNLRIPILPMEAGGVRSLNLSTAAGIMAYAALVSCGCLPAVLSTDAVF